MHDITCSDIKFIELKLKRINLSKERLIKTKPCVLNLKKYKRRTKYFKRIKQSLYRTRKIFIKDRGTVFYFFPPRKGSIFTPFN